MATETNPLGSFVTAFQNARRGAQQYEQQQVANQLTEQLRQVQLLTAQRQLAEANKPLEQQILEAIAPKMAMLGAQGGYLTQQAIPGVSTAEPNLIQYTAPQLAALEAASQVIPTGPEQPLMPVGSEFGDTAPALNTALQSAFVVPRAAPAQFQTNIPGTNLALSPTLKRQGEERALQDEIALKAALKSTSDPKTFTLSPGQTVFNDSGVPIASLPKESTSRKNTVVAPGSVVLDDEGNEVFRNVKTDAEKAAKPLPQTIAKRLSDGATAIDNLIKLKSYIDNPDVQAISGPVAGRTFGANPFSEVVGNFQGVRGTAKQNIGKFMEGGVLRLEDEKKYEKIIPSEKMLPAVQQNQAKELYGNLRAKYLRDIESYKKSGYDVSGYEDIITTLDAQFGNINTSPTSEATSANGSIKTASDYLNQFK